MKLIFGLAIYFLLMFLGIRLENKIDDEDFCNKVKYIEYRIMFFVMGVAITLHVIGTYFL